jgi:hypothetical protein
MFQVTPEFMRFQVFLATEFILDFQATGLAIHFNAQPTVFQRAGPSLHRVRGSFSLPDLHDAMGWQIGDPDQRTAALLGAWR